MSADSLEDAAPKPWWASKTVLANVGTVVFGGIIACWSYYKHGDATLAATAFAAFTGTGGLGIYGRVTATQPIGK
jgi:nitric oxide reductase large subunit